MDNPIQEIKLRLTDEQIESLKAEIAKYVEAQKDAVESELLRSVQLLISPPDDELEAYFDSAWTDLPIPSEIDEESLRDALRYSVNEAFDKALTHPDLWHIFYDDDGNPKQ